MKEHQFRENPFFAVDILLRTENYIRFHYTKSSNLINAANIFPELEIILKSKIPPDEKRMWIVKNVIGLGMKESAHFMRNIGYRNLAILDRHILFHLTACEVIEEIPKTMSIKKYLEIENQFMEFSKEVCIPMDELDLLFWSYQTGKILK